MKPPRSERAAGPGGPQWAAGTGTRLFAHTGCRRRRLSFFFPPPSSSCSCCSFAAASSLLVLRPSCHCSLDGRQRERAGGVRRSRARPPRSLEMRSPRARSNLTVHSWSTRARERQRGLTEARSRTRAISIVRWCWREARRRRATGRVARPHSCVYTRDAARSGALLSVV